MTAPETDAEESRTLASVSAPANVLLLAPALSDAADACPTVGTHDGTGPVESLLLVLLNGALEPRLDAWRRQGGLPESVSVVSCEGTRSAAAAATTTTMSAPDGGKGILVTSVSSPGNLATIGQSMDRWLNAEAGGDPHVCFDSLTTLLQYVDVRPTYQYLHTLLPRLTTGGALAHFHMDPGANDERTIQIIRSLFDATFRYDEATDEWTRY